MSRFCEEIFVYVKLYRLGKYEELGGYLDQLSDTVTEIQSVVRTGNEIMDAIISEKAEEAQKWNIRIQVDGDFRRIRISAVHLCTILGNLLDNAIEAVKMVEETDRDITITAKASGKFWLLIIKNRTDSCVEISDVNRIRTTKEDSKEHGFGLGNVERVVKKCGGEFRLRCQEIDGNWVFTAEVMIQKPSR